jgi:hypothetical protein
VSSFVDDFMDMCPQTVVWTPLASRDAYGKPVYGAAQTFTGRRIYKKSRVPAQARVRGEGAEVVSSSEIIILATPNIGYEDCVYILGDAAPFPPILNIERHVDEVSDQYVKVVMGSASG